MILSPKKNLKNWVKSVKSRNFSLTVHKNFPKFPGKSKKFPGINGNEIFREIPGNSRVPTLTAAWCSPIWKMYNYLCKSYLWLGDPFWVLFVTLFGSSTTASEWVRREIGLKFSFFLYQQNGVPGWSKQCYCC